jgi:hypothetical protein
MKAKRLENKRVLRLNKTTIVDLNHREMVKVKGGTDEEAHLNTGSESQYSRHCTVDTAGYETRLEFSFVQECNYSGSGTICLMPATDTC